MVEQKKPTFDTYQSFASVVFESGVLDNKPPKTPQSVWNEHVDAFAVLAFNSEATLSDVGEMFELSEACLKYRRKKIEKTAFEALPAELACFSSDKLQESYAIRPCTPERRRFEAREREDPIVPLMDLMKKGEPLSTNLVTQAMGDGVMMGEVRKKLVHLGYVVPEDFSKRALGKIEARRKQIENPNNSPDVLKGYFDEMTKSYFERLASLSNPTLVSFLHTLQGLGLPLNRRSSEALKFLGEKAIEKDIVVGILPNMVRQPDDTYVHKGTYYYHRGQDTGRIKRQKRFLIAQMEDFLKDHE